VKSQTKKSPAPNGNSGGATNGLRSRPHIATLTRKRNSYWLGAGGLLKKWLFMVECVLPDPRISATADRVMQALLHHCNPYTGQCNPSYSTIAKRLDIRRQSAIDAIDELEEHGYLKIYEQRAKAGDAASNHYEISATWKGQKIEDVIGHLVRNTYHPSTDFVPPGTDSEGISEENPRDRRGTSQSNKSNTTSTSSPGYPKNPGSISDTSNIYSLATATPDKAKATPEKPSPEEYAFEQGPVRLTRQEYAKWSGYYPHLNLSVELVTIADSQWLRDAGKDWRQALVNHLCKREREQMIKDMIRAENGPDPRFCMAGI
jgi:hypothetical protein